MEEPSNSENLINVKSSLTDSQMKSMATRISIINRKLDAKGYSEIQPFTEKKFENATDIYERESQLVGIVDQLLRENEVLREINEGSERQSKNNARLVNRYEELAGKSEFLALKNERKAKELEIENLKLRYTINDLEERKKGVELKIRDIRNGWEAYKSQVDREKRRSEFEKEELLARIKRRRCLPNQNTMRNLNDSMTENKFTSTELVKRLLTEKEKLKTKVLEMYGFIKNLYQCLEGLKASDGECPIAQTFLVGKEKLDELNYDYNSKALIELDKNFFQVLLEIKQEPFGSNDTFRSKTVGAQKQREVDSLRKQLAELQENYDKVVNTIAEWKKWREKERHIEK